MSVYGGRLTPIPMDTSVTGRRLALPQAIVPEIAKILRSYGDGEAHEGVVYLGGVETAEQSVALVAIAPVATTTRGSFRTDLNANAAVVSTLATQGLILIGQVHSHPGDWVDHSDGDDEGALVRFQGYWSLVVPAFARRGLLLTRCGIHLYDRGRFARLTGRRRRGESTRDPASGRSPAMTGIGGLTAEEFYQQRDHRTGLVVTSTAYREASVRITLASDATSFADQFAFLAAVNLTARWCRRIVLSAPAVALDPRLGTAFGLVGMSAVQAAAALAHAADPFARVGPAFVPEPEPAIHLVIGTDAPPGVYQVLGRGWIAMAGDAVRGDGDTENPLGAVLAACVGVAYLFRTAVGVPRPARVRLSLWNLRGGEAADHGPRLALASLGQVLVVGCGAVGSAILYLLPLAGLGGEFDLVDRDRVQISNLGTAPIFFAHRVGDEKVEIAVEYLKRNGLAAVAHPLWFDEAVAAGRIFVERPDLVIPAANERDVRREIQHQVPPLQVYGTTGGNWDAFLGRHIPLKEDCLTCRFPRVHPMSEPSLACGSGTLPAVPETETPVTATLPFLPTAAGVMAVAELVKTTMSRYPRNANFACLDFLGSLSDFLVVSHAPRPGCICEGQADVWMPLNVATSFARLSE